VKSPLTIAEMRTPTPEMEPESNLVVFNMALNVG
jgi:hypothetical protein